MTKIEASHRDVFDLSGPSHLCNRRLTLADKQAVVASLTQAVYVAEVDRQQQRLGAHALAPKWWSELGYEPISIFHEDEKSEPIVGMVFKRTDHAANNIRAWSDNDPCQLPIIVVALRGTMIRHGESLQDDMVVNLHIVLQNLHTTPRFAMALTSIRHAVSEVGLENVTITGHSLGAAVALLAGETLAYEGALIDCHLFNPPFPSVSLERIKSRGWKLGLSLASVACVAGLSYFLLDEKKRGKSLQEFLSLKVWHPHLYINVRDPVCSSYISYFNCQTFMQHVGASSLATLAAPASFGGTLRQYFEGDCKPFHLIPCAHLHIVNWRFAKLVRQHGLHQWWSPDLEFDYQKVNVGLEEQDMMSKEESQA